MAGNIYLSVIGISCPVRKTGQFASIEPLARWNMSTILRQPIRNDAITLPAKSKLVDDIWFAALACAGSVPGPGVERGHRKLPRRTGRSRDIQPR